MNYSHHETKAADLATQAAHLDSITRKLTRCCQTKETEIFDQWNLSPVEGQLLLIMAAKEESTTDDIAARLGVGRSRLTPLIQSLVEKGLLHRAESSTDRRKKDLTLTPAGEAAAGEAAMLRIKFHISLLRSFPAAKRKSLVATLTQLHKRMENARQDFLKNQD